MVSSEHGGAEGAVVPMSQGGTVGAPGVAMGNGTSRSSAARKVHKYVP